MDDFSDIFPDGMRPVGGPAPEPSQQPQPSAQPEAAAAAPQDDFSDMFPQGMRPVEEVSGLQAFGRAAARGTLPSLGGFGGGALGGAIGGALVSGPAAPFGIVAGALAGGIGGALATDRAQSYALSRMPDDWQEAVGQSDRDQRLGQEQHPYASFLGGMTPYALTMRPWGPTALPDNATNLQRLLLNPTTARLFSGAIVGGSELGNEWASGQTPDWARVAIATGFGTIFAHPTDLAQSIEGAAGRAVARVSPRRTVVPAAGAPAEQPPASRPFETEFPEGMGFEPHPQTGMEEYPEEHTPTLAGAWDLGIFGPATNEETHNGEVQRDPDAEQQANAAAAVLQSPAPRDPDVEARRAEPELFSAYDEAVQRVDLYRSELQRIGAGATGDIDARLAELRAQLPAEDEYQGGADNRRVRAQVRALEAQRQQVVQEQQNSATAQFLRERFQEADYHLRDVSREAARARREAAERIGSQIVPPEAPAAEPAAVAAPETAAQEPEPPSTVYSLTSKPTGFQTSKGSEYAVNDDGTTVRNKSFHPEHGVKDQGLKPRSEKTLYVEKPEDAAALSSAGLQGLGPHGARVVIKNGKASLLTWNIKENRWGISPGSRDIAVTAEPQLGYAPLELWKKTDDIPGYEAYSNMHAGNAITRLDGVKAQEPEPLIPAAPGEAAAAVPPSAVQQSAPEPIEAQHAAIAEDVRQKLIAAGRSDDEARATGALVAERYTTRAARMRGALGTARELYEREGPQITRALAQETSTPRAEETAATGAEPMTARESQGLPPPKEYRIAVGYNDRYSRNGVPLRWRRFQDWTPGKIVKVGFTDGLKVVGMHAAENAGDADGFVLQGQNGQVYNFTPHRGLAKLSDDEAQTALAAVHAQNATRELEQEKRGSIRLRHGERSTIRLARDADASTFVHESAHDWLEQMARDAEHPQAPQQMGADLAAVRSWLRTDDSGQFTRAQHEKFARGFEQYMREGVAPSARLAGVFAQFKGWLTQIYRTLKGLGTPISDDIRSVFDRMLAQEPGETVVSRGNATPPAPDQVHAADAEHFGPDEAGAAADRVARERAWLGSHVPEDIADEIERASAEVDAERAAAEGRGDEPGGEAGPGAGGLREVEPGGGEAGVVAERGSVGDGAGAQREVGNATAPVGGGVGRGGADRTSGSPQPLAPYPAERSSPGDTFNLGKNGDVRAENMANQEQFIQAINESAERTPGTDQPMTMGQMEAAAQSLLLEPHEISINHLAHVFGGVRDLNKKIFRLRQTIAVQSDRVVTAAARVNETGSDEDALAYGTERQRMDMFMSVFKSVRTEMGRGLGMGFRNLNQMPGVTNIEDAARAMTGRTLFQLKMEAKLIKTLKTPGQIAKWIRDAQTRSFGRMLLEYFVNNLISGVPTHVTYVLGGQVLLVNKMGPETLAAAMLGRTHEYLGREGDRVYAGEAGAQLREYMRAQPKAVQASIEALRSGQTTLLPGEEGHPTTPYQGDSAVGRVARTIVNDDVTWHEVGADAFGLIRGIRDGILANGALIASGGEAGAPAVGLHFSPLGQIPDIAIRGVPAIPVGSLWRIPGRVVGGLHSYQETLAYAIENNARAYRQATQEGHTGDAFVARVADLRQNPSEESMEASRLNARQFTLMDRSGAITQLVSKLMDVAPNLPILGETPILRFINPFVRIAANIMDRTFVERTPLGLLSKGIRDNLRGMSDAEYAQVKAESGDAAADAARGAANIRSDVTASRMIVGTVYALGMGTLAAEGLVTGSGPLDPNRRRIWQMAGYRAHSVRVGDIWYDVHRLGPLGMLLGVGADLHDVAHAATSEDMWTAAAMLQHAFTQNMLDESFMKGPAELINAIENPAEYGPRYLQGLASSFLPMSVGLGYMARASDPWSRQARDFVSSIKQKVPGLSETLTPRVDIWGNAVPNPDSLGGRGVTAIYESAMSRDPVNIALDQAGIGIASMRQTIRNIKLNDQQFHDLSVAAGRMTKQRLDIWVASPDWRVMPDTQKRQIVAEIVQESRNTARERILMLNHDIIVRSHNLKQDRFKEKF